MQTTLLPRYSYESRIPKQGAGQYNGHLAGMTTSFLRNALRRRYVIALALTIAALILTMLLHQWIGAVTLQIAVAAVVLSAWFGGLGPGMMSALLLATGLIYYSIEPVYRFDVARVQDVVLLAVFMLVAILISSLAEARHRSEAALRARTQELEAANQELEAFSYTVSHDLRSPLRAIDGYARIAIQKHGGELAEPIQRYLNLIRLNAQDLGRLIDDLLALSRFGRQGLKKEVIDASALVKVTLEELKSEQDNRDVEIKVGVLPVCVADPVLLKQVYINLLQNALKFTRRRPHATIEIGCLDRNDGPVYYVKDNGVGFNMAYSHNLFKVFHRLHKSQEYEGTGVGLAIVKRIIERHGGQIWAEGGLDEGAVFYFTLDRLVTS